MQFDVIYSAELDIPVKKFKEEFKNQEVIDSKGDIFLIWGAQDVPQDMGNLARGSHLWPFLAKSSLKTTSVYKSGIILLFKKLDKTMPLEELRNILISKIPEFHFSQSESEQSELLKELNKCKSHTELINIVYEE